MKLEKYEMAVKECSPVEITGVISTLRIKKGDVLVFQVEVGRLPPHRAQQHLKSIGETLKTVLPKECKLLLMPMRDGEKAEITVLQFE